MASTKSQKRHDDKLVELYGSHDELDLQEITAQAQSQGNGLKKKIVKAKPKVDSTNPIFKEQHFFENLSLAEKVHLHKVKIEKKAQNTDKNNKDTNGGWTTRQSDHDSAKDVHRPISTLSNISKITQYLPTNGGDVVIENSKIFT